MTIPGDPRHFEGGMSKDAIAKFSPNKKKILLLVRKGNVDRNTNDYSLLLWRTEDLFKDAKPEVVLSLSSSSNRPAIEQVTWLADNETIYFLGESPGEIRQLYSFKTSTRELKRLTDQPTSLLNFSVTPSGDKFAFSA